MGARHAKRPSRRERQLVAKRNIQHRSTSMLLYSHTGFYRTNLSVHLALPTVGAALRGAGKFGRRATRKTPAMFGWPGTQGCQTGMCRHCPRCESGCQRVNDLVASRLALRAPTLRAATALTRPDRSAQRLPRGRHTVPAADTVGPEDIVANHCIERGDETLAPPAPSTLICRSPSLRRLPVRSQLANRHRAAPCLHQHRRSLTIA
jgi:hypothetical protein